MNWVITHRHYTQLLRRGLIAICGCAVAGCWQEVEYTPPASSTSGTSSVANRPKSIEPPTSASVPGSLPDAAVMSGDAGGFGDDVAKSLTPAVEVKPADELFSDTARDAANLQPEAPVEPAPIEAEGAATSPIDDLFAPSAADDASSAPPIGGFESQGPPLLSEPPLAALADSPRERNTRRMAWLLGSKLSLAALANGRGAPAADVANWFDQSQKLAQMLGASAAALPQESGSNAATLPDQALSYLFAQGQQLGQVLARDHGAEQAALFELAVKSNILLALYQPGAGVIGALSDAIRQAAERSKLPAEIYQPLLDGLAQNAPAADVRDAVFKLHSDVDRYLSLKANYESRYMREPLR